MNYKDKFSVFTVFKILIMLLVIAATLYPFIYMVAISLSKNIYVLKNEVFLWPKGLNFSVYKIVLRDPRIFTAYKNTIYYALMHTIIALIATTGFAYALSKKNKMLFHSFFTFMVIIPMFFNGGMIPRYINMDNLHLINTRWAAIIPAVVSTYNLIIMRTFFVNFPEEIEESGTIDGLNDIGVLWYLVLPLSKAVLATIGLFVAVASWNSFFIPFIYLNNTKMYPLQVILREIVLVGANFDQDIISGTGDNLVVEDSLKYATIIVSVLPIIAVYPFVQKYFVKGVMVGSLKG